MRSDQKSSKNFPTLDKVLEGAVNMSSPGRASRGGSCFKENANINKYESPKLAVEPLQMKRKGKGGGYNLRKSLAWDRAFFTEDGVLEPAELSSITGASYQEGFLSVKDDDACSERVDQKKLGKSSSKNFLNVDKRRDRDDLSRKDCSSSLEHLMSTPTASPRVPASTDTKAKSRSGELSSSSLKRPGNVNVCKAALTDLKLPKVPCYKPGFSPKGATSHSLMLQANSVRHNQIVQSGADILGNEGTVNSSRSHINSKNGSKATSQQPAHISVSNPGYSLIKRPSSVSTSKALVDRANSSVAKTIPDNRRLSLATQIHSSKIHDANATCAAPLPQVSCVSGSTMHPLHNQTIKPSGLRMPSPSLSFFSRPKASALHNLTWQKVGPVAFESKRPGSLSFHGGTTYKLDEKISEYASATRNARASCMDPSHVSTFGLNNIKLEQDSSKNVGLKVFDDSHKFASTSSKCLEGSRVSGEIVPNLFRTDDRADRKSNEDKEVQKQIYTKVASQGPSYEDVIENKTIEDGDTVKSESCGRRNAGLLSEHNNAYGSESSVSLCEPHKLENNCASSILKNGSSIATQCLEVIHEGGQRSSTLQSHRNETLKIDGHDAYSGRNKLSVDLPSMPGKSPAEVYSFRHEKDLATEEGDDNKQSGCRSEIHQASLKAQTGLPTSTGFSEKPISYENSHKKANIERFPLLPDVDSAVSTDQTNRAHSAKVNICSSSSESQTLEMSEEPVPRISDGEPILDNKPGINLSVSTIISKVSETNESENDYESGTVPVKCFLEQSEYSALHNAESVCDDLVDGIDGLCSENCHEVKINIDGSRKVYELGEQTVDGSNELYEPGEKAVPCFVKVCESDASAVEENDNDGGSFSARELPLKPKSLNGAHESDDQAYVECARKDCSEIEPISDPTKTDVSSHEFCLKSDNANVEADEAPKNESHDDPKQKGSIVFPKNAVPFSDEWLAAIEAAGEDILTRKTGAVQNSPPEKPLPEPSPWSPVKKKNSQIGPHDCTKYTNNFPSDSN